MKSKFRNFIIISLIFFVNVFLASAAQAGECWGFGCYQSGAATLATEKAPTVVGEEGMNLKAADFGQSQIIGFFSDRVTLAIPPEFVSDDSRVAVQQLSGVDVLPWNLDLISPIYNISLTPSAGFDHRKALTITLAYGQANNDFKQVYYFDEAANAWRAVPTTDFPDRESVKAAISRSSLKVAVFARPGVLTVGKASWYKYKGGLFTASPDFPKGSKLRVTNLANQKSIEVTVNDWGPDRDRHPDRVVDLDKVAFAAIADTADGVIDVMVSPIELAADDTGRVLGVKADGLSNAPKISAKSAIIIRASDGSVVFDKNSGQNLPLASLTKIVAGRVFLDAKPDLERVVAYSVQDERYNALYVDSWESVKVRLTDGEKLTVKDLLYSALVGSANNAVESLVRLSGFSRSDFIAKMNEQVKLWGAGETKFVEPTGLSSANVSSAHDYALIMKAALTDDLLADITSAPVYKFTTLSKISHTIVNTNKLIAGQPSSTALPINASKTGYLVEAGYCLAARVKAKDDNYIIVSLGAPTRDASFNEMSDLINYLERII